MPNDNDPTQIEAALERLEQEKASRTASRIQAGTAVRVGPLVVGSAGEIDDAKAREIAPLRARGEAAGGRLR